MLNCGSRSENNPGLQQRAIYSQNYCASHSNSQCYKSLQFSSNTYNV